MGLYKEALSAAQATQSEYDRARVLSALAANLNLPKELYKEALSIAQAFQYKLNRAVVLSELVANYPKELYKEALGIQDEDCRANALNNLISQSATFPNSQNFTIWQEILYQGSQRKRTKSLSNLAASVPLLESLGGKAAGISIAKSIQQVAKWWR